jgi:hypothetical protein
MVVLTIIQRESRRTPTLFGASPHASAAREPLTCNSLLFVSFALVSKGNVIDLSFIKKRAEWTQFYNEYDYATDEKRKDMQIRLRNRSLLRRVMGCAPR